MSSNITLVKFDGEYRVDTRVIAESLGVDHRSTFRLVNLYKSDFEEFGVLRFEITKPPKGTAGGRPEKYAILNEDQCYLLLTYSDNTAMAREAKKALVRAFSNARNQSSIDSMMNLVLLHKPSTWERRFHPDYYLSLAKLTRTHYNGHAGGTPSIYGQITDKWVYAALLPVEVYAELKVRREKSNKMHQWLTNGGQEKLEQQIKLVQMLADSSVDLKDFEARAMQYFGMPGQLRIVYPRAA